MNKSILAIIFSVLFVVSCGGGGGGGGGGPATPTTPAPTVNLSADPTSVLLENTSTLAWSSNNATSCSASWTTQTGTSGSEVVTITTAGSNSFSITCSGAGGSGSASVTVEGYRETDGVVVDGYISGAEVCIDEDESWTCDANENSTTSDNEGKFTIRYANGNLVSIGGTDLDSQILLDNLLITHKLTGHSDFKAITPVTSIAAFMEDASLVNAALGIDSSIDVFTFDPVVNKGDGGINDYLYEKGNQLTVLAFALQNITNNLNTTTETTQDYFKAITEEIEKEYTETETKVDIETQAFVTKALENVIETKSVTIDETAKANVAKALSGMLPIIQVKSSDDLTTSVIRFAVSTLQTDIQAIANGTAAAEIVTSYTEDLLNYIAEDQSIDSGQIAPDINAIADTASTSEDTEVQINVLLNDSYVTSSPFSLSATNGTNGSTSISNNLITYSPDADYNGSDSFSYTINQGEKTSSADVTVTIDAVNDAPTIDIASTIQVEENQTAVTTVSVSDVDGDELTLTLDGTDADSFNLSDENVLTFKEAPDYETKNSYQITLSLTDGIETVSKDISIIILDVIYVFSGKVIDGYIDGAEIFIDQNFNFIKDNGEFFATSDSNGVFNIDINDESLATCLQKRPIIAEVPIGAIDSSLGEVSSAYQMILPSIKDSIDSNAAIYITPFTSLLGDAVIQGINSSNIVDEIDVSEGCGDVANSIAVNISNELLQITNTIESSLDISFEDLLVDFIEDNTSSTITEASAQKIAGFFPYFKELSDEFDVELSNIHGEIINTNLIIEEDAISSILSSSDIEEMPLSFNAIYETEPNELGWFIQEKIIANGAKVNSDGQIKHYTCFTNSENCITDTRSLDALRNASKRYTRTSTFLNNSYNPENYNYQLVIEDEQRVDLDINGNPKDRVCIYQNWLYLTPVNTRENFVTNDRYNTGISDGSNDNDDCSNVLANKNEALFVALVDKYDDGVDFEEIDIRITNPIYQNSTFFENKVNNIYQNRNNLDLDPLIQEIASVPRTFKDIENLRAKLTESSTDQISIFWTKRNAAGQQLESAKIDIKFDKSNDYFEYGTIENSSTGSEYTVVSSVEGEQAINNIADLLYSNSNIFNSSDYLSYAPIFTSESNFNADENQTDIGTVTAVDGDGDTVSFSISGDEISISTDGVLAFVSAPDYETKSTYTAKVTASDGVNASTQDIIVNVINLNDNNPVITSADSFNANENQTSIGTVTATDADNDDITFTVSGSEITISSAGVLTFVSAPDYETKSEYTATVTASDGVNEATQDITINIINLIEITAEENININENTQTADYSITDAGGSSVNLEIIRDYGKDFTPTNTIGNSDGTNFVLNDNVVINDGEIYQALSDIQIADGASITIKAGGKLISRYVEVDGSYSRPPFSTGVTFSNTYGEGIVMVSNDGTNYEEENSVGNQNILLFDGSSFVVEGTKDNPAEIRNISVAFATKETSDNASINIDYVNWRGGSLHPYFFYRTNAQSSYIRGSLKLTNSYLSFVNSVNLMRLDRRGRSEDIIIEDNVFHNSGGFSLDFNYQTSGLLRIQRNLYFGEDVYRTNKPAFLSIGITGGTSQQYPKHTDDRTKVLFKDNAILATPDSSKAIYCENYDAYVPWEGNYFGYRADFDNTVRKTITDKSSDLSKTCSYPNSLILLEPPRTWDIRPDFYFTQDDKIIMDVPVDYESATNKIIPFNIKATNSNNESKVLDMQMTVIDIDEPAEPIISEILDQISVQENTVFVSNFSVKFDSNDTVTMSLSGDDADKFEVSSNNLLAFKTAPNYEAPTDTDADNIYDVTLTASTGSASTSIDINVTVTNQTEENDSPVLTEISMSPTSVDVTSESKDVTVSLKVTDASGVTARYVARFRAVNLSVDSIQCPTMTLSSGTDKDGVWSTTCTIPAGQVADDYYFQSSEFIDANGIRRTCYTSNYSGETNCSGVDGEQTYLEITNDPSSSDNIYYLYGGAEQSDYLGCYGCANTSSDSVCNSVGTYGSNVSSSSIWNTVGSYGSTVGTYSPWNSVSTSPPEFFNQDKTTTYGKFTVNTATANRTTVTKLTNIIDYFNNNSNDIAATRDYACEQTQSAAPINSLSSDKPNLNLSNKVIFD